MVINNNALRKMLIRVDTDSISPESARKLNKILLHYEMKLNEDGWYTGTNEHCKSVISFIIRDMGIFNSLKQWILHNPDTNSMEDCKASHLKFLEEWKD